MRQILAEATRQLAAMSDTPRLDAELLMAHALGVTREMMLLGIYDVPPTFPSLFARRLACEPIAYITGRRSFWTIELEVTPDVLIPRPDSETLIEAAVGHFRAQDPSSVLDLGTGSGALLLAALAEWPEAKGLGIDSSTDALAIASRNTDSLGMTKRALFRQGDWADGIGETFDLVLCNPPYVESGAQLARQVVDYEPAEALFAGPDGLDAYRKLAPQLPSLISRGGVACVEIGATQSASVTVLLQAQGLTVTVRRDLAGHDRCLVAAPAN